MRRRRACKKKKRRSTTSTAWHIQLVVSDVRSPYRKKEPTEVGVSLSSWFLRLVDVYVLCAPIALDAREHRCVHKNIYAPNQHGRQLRARCVIWTNKNRARSSRADSPLACHHQPQQLRALLVGIHSKSRSRSCDGSWRNSIFTKRNSPTRESTPRECLSSPSQNARS